MDVGLIAASSLVESLHLVWVIFEVALMLGLVIFVHELGHFAVAKWCGVKCEKFYLGFDIYGLRLARFRWGETEYGIGILPLGGYVKMLGQDDNPANMAQEVERAKAQQIAAQHGGPPVNTEGHAVFDPRSYLAQSVPKRMAIISAGVVMNLIFAVIFGATAYALGAKYTPCTVAGVMVGEAAWKQGLHPGDDIIRINDVDNPGYMELKMQVGLSWRDQVVLQVRRFNSDQVDELVVPLDRDQVSRRLTRTIGVMTGWSNTLVQPEELDMAAVPHTAAAQADPPLLGGDQIVAIDGSPLSTYGEIHAAFARHPDRPLVLTVQRIDEEANQRRELTVNLPPSPLRHLGLRMKWGSVTAVQKNSPAAVAGLRPGDEMVAIDGTPVDEIDPAQWPAMMRQRSRQPGAQVELTVRRDQQEQVFQVPLRDAHWYEQPQAAGHPMSVESLGLAYQIEPQVAAVEPGTPAAKHAELIGRRAVKAVLVPPEDQAEKEKKLFGPLEFDFEQQPNWPYFLTRIQNRLPETKIHLYFENSDQPVELATVQSDQWFNPDREPLFDAEQRIRRADSFGQAVAMGWRKTVDSVLQVYLFLVNMFRGAVSPKSVSSPINIVRVAGHFAYEGLGDLLLFMTLLSANLAVLNFLPIPLLDGGHMMFLTYEAIFRRPPSLAVQQVLNLAGLFLLLGLMGWAVLLDLNVIDRFGG